MLSYELAKKLKEAGFPQKNTNFISSYRNGEKIYSGISIDIEAEQRIDNEIVYCPTLEELIDSFGDKLFAVVNLGEEDNRWGAKSRSIADEEFYYGQTPSEAVARLYLAINGK